MGRPKYKDIDKVKNKFIHIRFTEKELYLLKSAAKKEGVSVSDLVRFALNNLGIDINLKEEQ